MKLTYLLIILTLVVPLGGNVVHAQESDEATLLELVESNDEFSILASAIETARLEDALADEDANLTILAPTDAAFVELVTAMDMTADDLLADEALLDTLIYHVLPERVVSSDIDAGLETHSKLFADTLYGAPVIVETSNGAVFVNGIRVVSADTMASNGVIHVLEGVLTPPQSIWETVETAANPAEDSDAMAEFTILAQAISIAKLDADLASPEASFTVFAPTDAAFEEAAAALNLAPSDLLQDPEFVSSILLGHVVEGEITSVDLIDMFADSEAAPLETLNPESDATLQITIDDDGLLVNGARIIQADIVTRNGVIHVIDTVLLPE